MINTHQQELILSQIIPYKPNKIGIFGSFSRDENTSDSDIDIWVSFNETPTLFDLIDMENELTMALGIKAEIITERSVHPRIKPYIEKDLKIIYE